jgi:predicted dinucleotide-binding enzyme
MKKIGIIGSGIVAQTLGAGFLKHGYDVMLGTRSPAKLEEWQSNLEQEVEIGGFSETADFGDILVLAVKGTVARQVIDSIDDKYLDGKTIMDATNPIADLPPEHGVLQFFTDQNGSLMEALQEASPSAHFVKAFSSIGSAKMVNPQYELKPSMFICGNNESAKAEVSVILDQFGWETQDMGAVEAARAIEPLCMLWCIPGFLNNEWTHAFKLLKQ